MGLESEQAKAKLLIAQQLLIEKGFIPVGAFLTMNPKQSLWGSTYNEQDQEFVEAIFLFSDWVYSKTCQDRKNQLPRSMVKWVIFEDIMTSYNPKIDQIKDVVETVTGFTF